VRKHENNVHGFILTRHIQDEVQWKSFSHSRKNRLGVWTRQFDIG